jgi:hypothetical protein
MSYEDTEQLIYDLVLERGPLTPSEIESYSGYSKRYINKITSSLLFKKRISATGSIRNPKYYAHVKISKEEKEIRNMKISVKDFNIIPILCPSGLMNNCAVCIYAKTVNVHNCSTNGSRKTDFGFVECNYFDEFQKRLEKAEKDRE